LDLVNHSHRRIGVVVDRKRELGRRFHVTLAAGGVWILQYGELLREGLSVGDELHCISAWSDEGADRRLAAGTAHRIGGLASPHTVVVHRTRLFADKPLFVPDVWIAGRSGASR